MKSIRSLGHLGICVLLMPLTFLMTQASPVTADYSNTDLACASGEVPNITGAVTASGSSYSTTVEILALGPDAGTTSITNYVDSIFLGTAETTSSGAFNFCAGQDLLDLLPQYGVTNIAAVAAARTNDSQNTFGTTSSSVNSITCLVLGNCNFNVAMATSVFAGVVKSNSVGVDGAVVSLHSSTSESLQIVADVRTDSSGRFAIGGTLPDGSYKVFVDPSGSSHGILPFESTMTVTAGAVSLGQGISGSSPIAAEIQLDQALLVGRITTPTGAPISTSDGPITVYVIELNPERCDLTNVGQLGVNGCFRNSLISDDGHFTAVVGAGNWFIVATGPFFFGGYGAVNVAGDGTLTEIAMPVTTDSLRTVSGRTYLDVALTPGNFEGKVAHPVTGESIPGSTINVSKFNAGNFEYVLDQPKVRPDGGFTWKTDVAASSSAIFKFVVGPNQDSLTPTSAWNSLASRTLILKVENNGGQATVTKTCTLSYEGGPPTANCDGNPEASTGGVYPIKPNLANIKLSVCAPGTGSTCALIPSVEGGTRVEYKKWNVDNENFQWFELGGSGFMRSTLVQDYIEKPSAGSDAYEITAYAPTDFEGALAADKIWFTLSSTGVFTKCSQRPTSQVCPVGTGSVLEAVSGVSDLGTMRFRTPQLIATVQDPDGNGVGRSWIQFFEVSENGEIWLGSTESSSNGQVALDSLINSAGTYEIQADPPYDSSGSSGRLSKGSTRITVTGTAGSFVMAPASPIVILKRPNIEGRVLAGANPVSWTNVGVEKWNEDIEQWRYSNQSVSTDRNGTYFINLGVGRWRLEGNAPSSSTDYTSGFVEVVVGANGNVVSVNGAAYSSGAINIALRSPNVTGTVYAPGNPNTTASNVGLQFQKWSDSSNTFEWIQKWTETKSLGRFSTVLEEGRYRVTASPFQSNSLLTSGYAFIKVTASGQNWTVTGCNNASDIVCSNVLGAGVVIVLEQPNVKGTVKAGPALTNAGVNVEKWNSDTQYFEWANLYANSNTSTGFLLKLDAGVYRFSADAWGLEGFSRASRIISVDGDTWCEQPFNSSTMTLGTACVKSNQFSSGGFVLNLPGANVKGTVKFNGQLVGGQSWVNVSKIDSVTGSQTWTDIGAQVQSGKFWLSLPVDASSHYRVTLNAPNPNPNNLTRKSFDVWIGDFVNGGETNDVCLTMPDNGVCTSPITSGTAFDVNLSAGNIQGTVLNPSGAPIGQVGINVLRRENNYWTWVDAWAESSSSTSSLGKFSFDLKPDSGTATYQINARPFTGSFSPGKTTIQVNAAGNWCEVVTGSTCEIPLSMAANANIGVRLSNPNVTGRVLNTSSVPLRDAWVEIQKWNAGEGTLGQNGYRPGYWQYVDGLGDNTDSLGAFQLLIDEVGLYKINVNPPWNGSGLARFSDEFTVEMSGSNPVAVGLGTAGDLQFPSPNISTRIYMPGTSTTTVSDAWVNLVKVEGSGQSEWLQWVDAGGNSNRQGVVNLNFVEPGTYKLVVNPPWNSTALARFATPSFTIDADGVVSGLALSIRFPAPNVSGLVTWKDQPTDSVARVMQNGWVGVYNQTTNSWVDGIGIRPGGKYDIYLPDGQYSLSFFPNIDGKEFAPITKTVTVSGGAMTAGTLFGATTITFGESPPTVKVTVKKDGVIQPGAAVRLTSGSTSYTFQTDSAGQVSAYVPDGTYSVRAGKVDSSGSTDVVRTGQTSNVVVSAGGLVLVDVAIS